MTWFEKLLKLISDCDNNNLLHKIACESTYRLCDNWLQHFDNGTMAFHWNDNYIYEQYSYLCKVLNKPV